jgi:hypothetical protein
MDKTDGYMLRAIDFAFRKSPDKPHMTKFKKRILKAHGVQDGYTLRIFHDQNGVTENYLLERVFFGGELFLLTTQYHANSNGYKSEGYDERLDRVMDTIFVTKPMDVTWTAKDIQDYVLELWDKYGTCLKGLKSKRLTRRTLLKTQLINCLPPITELDIARERQYQSFLAQIERGEGVKLPRDRNE